MKTLLIRMPERVSAMRNICFCIFVSAGISFIRRLLSRMQIWLLKQICMFMLLFGWPMRDDHKM